jgi:hypothetical protein
MLLALRKHRLPYKLKHTMEHVVGFLPGMEPCNFVHWEISQKRVLFLVRFSMHPWVDKFSKWREDLRNGYGVPSTCSTSHCNCSMCWRRGNPKRFTICRPSRNYLCWEVLHYAILHALCCSSCCISNFHCLYRAFDGAQTCNSHDFLLL